MTHLSRAFWVPSHHPKAIRLSGGSVQNFCISVSCGQAFSAGIFDVLLSQLWLPYKDGQPMGDLESASEK